MNNRVIVFPEIVKLKEEINKQFEWKLAQGINIISYIHRMFHTLFS